VQLTRSLPHALCNVHYLRDLTFVEEEYQQGRATDRKALLREMKAATEPTLIRGCLAAPRKRGQERLAALEMLFASQPFYPVSA
jgi:hypothetical protein